jgi:hypothetical protein
MYTNENAKFGVLSTDCRMESNYGLGLYIFIACSNAQARFLVLKENKLHSGGNDGLCLGVVRVLIS